MQKEFYSILFAIVSVTAGSLIHLWSKDEIAVLVRPSVHSAIQGLNGITQTEPFPILEVKVLRGTSLASHPFLKQIMEKAE